VIVFVISIRRKETCLPTGMLETRNLEPVCRQAGSELETLNSELLVRPGVLSAQTGSIKKQIPQRLAGASFGRPAPLLHYVF
jgi:hypothetical protein